MNGPLWFMRDLFLISLLSPALFVFLRCRKKEFIYLLIALSIFGPICFGSIRYSPLLFFSLGAYIAINDIDVISFYKSHRKGLILSFWTCFFACFFIGGEMTKIFYIISFVLIVFGVVSENAQYLLPLEKMSKYSLVLYCTHVIIGLPIANRIVSKLPSPFDYF